jgi:CO/xanthine dehydrogenase Mo-binding subunit
MLSEYVLWYEGRVMNPDQLGYMVPLATDMPRINNVIVETIDPSGPYGAKEAGMSVAMSAAQAYCSAVCNAIGTEIKEFPLTPDRILKAIEEKNR